MNQRILFPALATILFLLAAAMPALASNQVWDPEHEWSIEWEIEYAKWCETLYHFYRAGGGAERYLPMRTNAWGDTGAYLDCSDLLYASRAIFAYERKLPFMVHLSGILKEKGVSFDRNDMGHFQTNYSRHAAGDKRFRAFLADLLQASFSCTINDDTFPIAVRPDVLMPGMVFAINPVLTTGHSYLIYRVEMGPDIKNKANQPVMVIGGTVPANIPLPEYYLFKQEGRLMWKDGAHTRRGGFRAWLVPVPRGGKWHLEIPEYGKRWYSEEQYEQSFVRMHQIMTERFRVAPLPADKAFRAAIEAIGFSLVKRQQIIEDGTRRWIHMGRPKSLSEATLNDLGTVNTDRRIAFAIREADGFPLDPRSKAILLDEYVFDVSARGEFLTMGMIFDAFLTEKVSPSPIDPPLARWGVPPGGRTFTAAEIGQRKRLPDNSIPEPGDYRRILQPETIADAQEVKMRETIKQAVAQAKVEAKEEPKKKRRPDVKRNLRHDPAEPGQGSRF